MLSRPQATVDEFGEALQGVAHLADVAPLLVEWTRRVIGSNGVCFIPYHEDLPFGTYGAFSHDEFPSSVMREHTLAMFPLTTRDLGPVPQIFDGREGALDLNRRFEWRELERTETYNEYWRPFKLERQLLAFVGRPGDASALLAVSRSRRDTPFNGSDVRSLQAVAAHLGRRLPSLMRRAAPVNSVLSAIASGLPNSAALFDASGRMLWASERARQDLGVHRSASSPESASNTELMRWRNLACSVIAHRSAPGVHGDLSVQRVDAGRGVPAALIILQERSARLESRVALACSQFHLTPRESELLVELTRGRANKEIARDLGCSVRTVEAHVASILRKSGAATRVELIARLGRDS